MQMKKKKQNLLVRFAIYEQINYVIRISEFKGAGDRLVKPLSLRRCLAHIVQYSA